MTQAGLTTREQAIVRALDAVRARCDAPARRSADPVSFAHRYSGREDRELVALVSACIAFGNVKTIRAKLDDLLTRLGPDPARASENARALRGRLRGWKHRVFIGDDIARLLSGARSVQREHGSLGAFFAAALDRADRAAAAPSEKVPEPRASGKTRAAPSENDPVRHALSALCIAIRRAGGLGQVRVARVGPRAAERPSAAIPRAGRRGPAHLLPEPRGASGNKRLLLFLRWMVRPADGIDLGDWPVAASRLLVPVDVHIHKLARNLGLTARPDLSWRTTEEITRALARFDPEDPVKYDFSLCHMGMLQHCPSRADSERCRGCGVRPVCIHWEPPSETA